MVFPQNSRQNDVETDDGGFECKEQDTQPSSGWRLLSKSSSVATGVAPLDRTYYCSVKGDKDAS